MYVRMIVFTFRPSVTIDLADEIYDDMLALMEPLPGYQGLTLLTNEETHQAISLSYWSDQSSAVEAGAKILPLLMERTRGLVEQSPEVEGFNLIRQDFLAG